MSRVAGQRLPAPPSKFSKEGGFRNNVLRGILGEYYFSICEAWMWSKSSVYAGSSILFPEPRFQVHILQGDQAFAGLSAGVVQVVQVGGGGIHAGADGFDNFLSDLIFEFRDIV